MNKIKHFLTSNIGIATSFVLAVALLLFGSVGGAQAALTYYSETYASQVEMHDIGVTLVENGTDISNRDYFYEVADGTWDEHTGVLLANMLTGTDGTRGKLQYGKSYQEALAAKNSGNIDTYVRVTVYKYWIDPNGNKTRDMDPALIELNFVNLGSDWILDEGATTAERNVLYYNKLLPVGATTPVFSDTLRIDGNIQDHVTVKKEMVGDTQFTRYSYDYNGYKFILEATVDAVQDHNAEAAILSAWGKDVTVTNNTLSLN